MNTMTENIHWLGHDSFRIEADEGVVYIDPWNLKKAPPADLVLVTHEHHDHCSPDDIAKVQTPDTVVVTIAAAADKLAGDVRVVVPGDKLTVRGIPVEAVPAYNLNKFRSPGIPFHPKEAAHVGFIVTLGGYRIYHGGDTDHIPEMADFDVDIALLPVSGTYVMTAAEAVEAASAIQPKLAIPMHVGAGIGALSDADYFKQYAAVPVEILPQEE